MYRLCELVYIFILCGDFLPDVCICISGLDALLGSNPLVIAAVAFAGTATVKAEITKMVNTSTFKDKSPN
ncbi:hypothetical protein K474DRAFT_1656970 [Panus rudis PR-1116 ss-1]|nr:hypothetical protein K474DRAFT_1656970 [Panus rudis PR-1116 ss-1]